MIPLWQAGAIVAVFWLCRLAGDVLAAARHDAPPIPDGWQIDVHRRRWAPWVTGRASYDGQLLLAGPYLTRALAVWKITHWVAEQQDTPSTDVGPGRDPVKGRAAA